MAKKRVGKRKAKKKFNKALLLIPFLVLALLVVTAVIGIILLVILVGLSHSPSGEDLGYSNNLYLIAKEAPRSSEGIVYADLKKVIENEYLIEQGEIPDLRHISFLFGHGGMIQMSKGEEVMVVESKPIEIALGIAPHILNLVSGLSEDIPSVIQINYRGEKFHVIDGTAYWIHEGRIFFATEKTMKKFLVSQSSNAISEFETVISKLDDRDIMLAFRVEETQKIGITAFLENDMAKAKIVMELPTPETAALYGIVVGKLDVDGINFKSVRTESNLLYLEADAKLDKLSELSQLFSPMPATGGGGGGDNGTSLNISDIPLGDIVPPEMPCNSTEECEEYCIQNPEECENLLEQYTNGPCCAECLKAYVSQGYGLESIGKSCLSLPLNANCSAYFKDNPHNIIDCYSG